MTHKDIPLKTNRKTIATRAYYFPSIPSTNSWLMQQSNLLDLDGLMIYTDQQTAGRGRMERVWEGGQAGQMYCSFVLKPNLPIDLLATVTLWIGLALCRLLNSLRMPEVSIKWPNDVLVKGKKVAGILCEMKAESPQRFAIVAGVGVNLNGSQGQYSEELQTKAATLEQFIGNPVNRDEFMDDFLNEVDRIFSTLTANGISDLIQEWNQLSSSVGKRVAFEHNQQKQEGQIKALDEKGNLIIISDKGEEVHLLSGEIVFI